MTRPADRGATDGGGAAPPRRTVTRVPGVPGGRAVVGGLLIALAGVGTFVSWQRAVGVPERSYAVAGASLAPGDPVTADAVRFVPMDLPASVAGAAFETAADLEGRVVVAPVGEGELLQRGVLSDQSQAEPAAEVSVTLARDLAVDGRLRPGDTVEVYATDDAGTRMVAAGVRVLAVTDSGGSFGDGRELTVTLALADDRHRVPVIHAARGGQVTLVRTTHVARRPPAPALPDPPPALPDPPPDLPDPPPDLPPAPPTATTAAGLAGAPPGPPVTPAPGPGGG